MREENVRSDSDQGIIISLIYINSFILRSIVESSSEIMSAKLEHFLEGMPDCNI